MIQHFPEVNFRWLLLGEGDMFLSGENMAKFAEISSQERVKLLSIIGKKDVQLQDQEVKMEEVFQFLMKIANVLEQLPVVKEAEEEWRPLRDQLEQQLSRLRDEFTESCEFSLKLILTEGQLDFVILYELF